MNYFIEVKDEDTGLWRTAEDSDGLTEPNEFSNRLDAEDAARAMVRRCAYRFPWKVVQE